MQALTRPEPKKASRPKDFKTKNEKNKEGFDECFIVEIITAWMRRIRMAGKVGVPGTCRVRSADIHRARTSTEL
jgi:hypothetical protein